MKVCGYGPRDEFANEGEPIRSATVADGPAFTPSVERTDTNARDRRHDGARRVHGHRVIARGVLTIHSTKGPPLALGL